LTADIFLEDEAQRLLLEAIAKEVNEPGLYALS
jgi:hypothetical protein